MDSSEAPNAASVYCSTSGTFFTDKHELAEHYRSDFHRYNLKRKIAGLPPVTKEWFDSRKEQLSSTAALAAQQTWTDPLTKRRFGSENTYNAFTRSRKYQDLVKKSGQPQPKPYVTIQRAEDKDADAQTNGRSPGVKTHSIKAPNSRPTPQQLPDDEAVEGSDWETASEDEEASEAAGTDIDMLEAWHVCRSFFDNKISSNLDSNLEYMWKNFGFYLPDSEYLEDPEGLLKYLGAKLAEGHLPLYTSGLDANAKQFASLHAVQRHMVDTNQCKMAYDGVEEEYEDFYDYSKALSTIEEGGVSSLATTDGPEASTSGATGGYELAVADTSSGGGGKILGSRDFARYYRQNHRPETRDRTTRLAELQQRYRNLGVALIESPGEAQAKRAVKQAQKATKKGDRIRLRTDLQTNVNRNLPRNVTY